MSTAALQMGRTRLFRWRLAIPPEKGGWIWWLGPFAVGAAAAGGMTGSLLLVLAGTFASFCIRQPLTLAARQLRRGRDDIVAELTWSILYAVLLLCVAGGLLAAEEWRVLALGTLMLPVLLWHLALVYLGRERRQFTLDITAGAALALAGPAAYWAAGGDGLVIAFWIWCLTAAQSVASIVHMFSRLELRALTQPPPMRERLMRGGWAMSAHSAALVLALLAVLSGTAHWLVLAAMAVPAAEGTVAVLRPQVGHTPRQLGMRQLAVSTGSMFLLTLGLTQ